VTALTSGNFSAVQMTPPPGLHLPLTRADSGASAASKGKSTEGSAQPDTDEGSSSLGDWGSAPIPITPHWLPPEVRDLNRSMLDGSLFDFVVKYERENANSRKQRRLGERNIKHDLFGKLRHRLFPQDASIEMRSEMECFERGA